MKRLIYATALVLLAVATSRAEDFSGLWNWTTPGQNGGLDRIYNLRAKVEDGALTGTILSPNRTNDTFTEIAIRNGKIEGDTISFTVARAARARTNAAPNAVAGADGAAAAGGATRVANRAGGGGGRTNAPTQYIGKLTGTLIEGVILSPGRGGKTVTNVWKATRNANNELVAGTRIVVKPGYNEAGYKIVNDTKYKDVSPDEVEKYLKDHPDAIILDSREPESFAEAHLPHAQNHNLTDAATYKDVLSKLDKTKRYVVYSATGHYRTVRALEYFEANGFGDAIALDGGIAAWEAAGKPVEK